jgi:hypothetical protein
LGRCVKRTTTESRGRRNVSGTFVVTASVVRSSLGVVLSLSRIALWPTRDVFFSRRRLISHLNAFGDEVEDRRERLQRGGQAHERVLARPQAEYRLLRLGHLAHAHRRLRGLLLHQGAALGHRLQHCHFVCAWGRRGLLKILLRNLLSLVCPADDDEQSFACTFLLTPQSSSCVMERPTLQYRRRE